MTDMVTFRTSDLTRWGTGQGSRLNKGTIDINFWVLLSRLVALEDHAGVTGRGIEDIFIASGSDDQMYVALTDSTILGPFTLPKTKLNFTNPPTGDWLPLVGYSVDDIFVDGSSLYIVRFAHTSAATFDPNATDGSGHDYYRLLLTIPPTPVRTKSTATYTPSIADANTYMLFTHSAGATFHVPAHADVAFPIGTEFTLYDDTGVSEGGLIVDALSPAHIKPVGGHLNLSATSGATIGLKKIDTDTWTICGLLMLGSP